MHTAVGFTKLSDEKLYDSLKKLGRLLLHGRNIFLIMLPEVNRRNLFSRKGFSSIFHFAKVIGGVSEGHVRRVLNVDERFQYLPIMKTLLLSGKVSVSKLAKVVSVVTTQNQEYWANQIQILPARAIETLVRDYHLTTLPQKDEKLGKSEDTNGLFKPQIKQETVHVNSFEHGDKIQITQIPTLITPIKTPELSDEVKQRLNELQAKYIDINEIILEALDRYDNEILEEKDTLTQKAEAKALTGEQTSRTPSSATKRLLKKVYGTKCAIETCKKTSVHIHHTARHSVSHSHNPHFLAPLCKEHHQIAHAADVKATEIRNRLHQG